MDNQRVAKTLGHLCRIVEAGERGYAVSAANVSNRALKLLFLQFAQQRADFKEELLAEIQRLGGYDRSSNSFLGIVHRGRIDIFAALTIGAENVEKTVLKEVMVGERVALATFERTLRKDLSAETRELVSRQYEAVKKVVDQVRLMRGRNGRRLVVRLYDSKADAEKAVQSLKQAGIPENEIRIENLASDKDLKLYSGNRNTILETIISGAVGGAIWGTIAGTLAALGVFQMAQFNMGNLAPLTLQLFAVTSLLGLIVGGAFVGSMIGLFIGWGISGADRYVSDDLKNGQVFMRATVDESLSSQAWRIMNQIAMEARTLHASAKAV